jgi:hypothetical protein
MFVPQTLFQVIEALWRVGNKVASTLNIPSYALIPSGP